MKRLRIPTLLFCALLLFACAEKKPQIDQGYYDMMAMANAYSGSSSGGSSSGSYSYESSYASGNAAALDKARSYLNSSAFSYQGLIGQLEYSGFTSSEAKYGADHCGADWNEQAAKKAKSYMRTFPDFTRSELINQLEYEKFTYSQAVYGADHYKSY